MIVQKNFFKIIICVFGIYFIISCLRPNVLRQIGKSKIYGAMAVPELDGCLNGFRGEWEWMEAFETMGAISIDYKKEFLREDVASISLHFFMKIIVLEQVRGSFYLKRIK